jgi:hypothetical protein
MLAAVDGGWELGVGGWRLEAGGANEGRYLSKNETKGLGIYLRECRRALQARGSLTSP